jgi:hypothetical protein
MTVTEPLFLTEDELSDLHTIVAEFVIRGGKLEYGDPIKILTKLEALLDDVG